MIFNTYFFATPRMSIFKNKKVENPMFSGFLNFFRFFSLFSFFDILNVSLHHANPRSCKCKFYANPHSLSCVFLFHKKAPTCSLSNMQGLSCHILSSVIFAHKVPDNLFFFFLFRCNFCCCFCMFFAIANDHKCHAEYY